jgi:iron complex outermembrane receptor protein
VDENIFYASLSTNFTYSHPVSKNFGYTISGNYDKMGPGQTYHNHTYNTNSATFGSSLSKPVYTNILFIFGGQIGERSNLGTTMDWRVTPNSVLSWGTQLYYSSNYNGDYRVGFSTGTIATPTVAGGVSGSYGPDFTIGATGRGAVTYSQNTQVQFYKGARTNLRYNIDRGDWKVDLKVAHSVSIFRYSTVPENGFIRSVSASSTTPLRVEFRAIDPVTGPGDIKVFDVNNQPVNTGVPAFHSQTAVTTGTTLVRDTTDNVSNYGFDVRRALNFSPFPAAIKIGGVRKEQERDRYNDIDRAYTYFGPNGNPSAAPYLTPPFEAPGTVPHVLVSPYKAAAAWKDNPSLFSQTPAQLVATERLRRQNSEVIEETADALYLQLEARFFENRLNVLTGVRYERTASDGLGSNNTPDGVWQRNANGTFVVGANGARVRKPEAGAAGSLQELDFIWHERATRSKRSYDGYYPSLHLTYNFTEKLQSRAAYAKTYGRPNFSFIIPRTVVSEFTNQAGDVTGGRLTVRNPGLLPWSAENYDITTEYYTDQGGVFGANVFRKDVTDFFGSETRDATPLELQEVGVTPQPGESWQIVTTNNVGNARITGLELSANQSLKRLDPWLAGWGGNFRVFANVTKIRLKGNRTADFTGFLPTSASWGVQFGRKRVNGSVKWNYRSDQNTGAVTNLGANGHNYVPARTHMDVNFGYNITPNLAVFINMRNVGRVYQKSMRTSDELADYARMASIITWEGITSNFGIKGSF